jgi:phage tail-like protein
MAVVRNDPFGAFSFVVEIPNIGRAGFMEVLGLEFEVGVIEYREGNDSVSTVRKLPGITKYSKITLKRGLTADHSLWDWARQTVQGNVQRVDIAIIMLNDQRQPVLRWIVRNAWVSKYQGPTLNAGGNEVAIESLEIAHEGLEREAV